MANYKYKNVISFGLVVLLLRIFPKKTKKFTFYDIHFRRLVKHIMVNSFDVLLTLKDLRNRHHMVFKKHKIYTV